MSFVRYTVHLLSLSLCFSLLHSRLLSLTQNTNNNNNSNSSLQLRRAAAAPKRKTTTTTTATKLHARKCKKSITKRN